MKNLNNQLIGKDKYIEIVQDNRSYLIEDFTDLNGCFVFATKDKTYALTDVISSDYYSFQTYQGNNYIVFAEGFPINDFKTFKIIKPSEIISIPFTFNKVSSITPDALNRNFGALKDLCLVLQETMNNRVMRLDTTDGQVMLPELEPQQLWVKDTKNTYKAISLSDFKELAETLLSDYVELIKNMLNILYENARDNIIMTKNNAIKELQVFLENVLSEVELYTSSKKKELDSYTQDKKHELDLYVSGIKPIQYGTVAELQATKNLKIGDVVGLSGYYIAGDGAGHTRKIELADDGSGVQLANGLWANIVHNGEVNVSWFGAKGDGATDDSPSLRKAISFSNVILFSNKTYNLNSVINITKKTSLLGNGTVLNLGGVGEGIKYTVGQDMRRFRIKGITFNAKQNITKSLIVKIPISGVAFADNAIEENVFYAQNDSTKSFVVETEGRDGYFNNKFQNNVIFNGNFEGGNFGDSNLVQGNIIAGKGEFKVTILTGSNSNVIKGNNITCAKGIEIVSGGNNIITQNNIESFRPVDIDTYFIRINGKKIGDVYPALNTMFFNNSVTFVNSADTKINGILLTDVWYANLNDNLITTNNNNPNFKHITFEGDCNEITIEQKSTSSIDNEITLSGVCRRLNLKTNKNIIENTKTIKTEGNTYFGHSLITDRYKKLETGTITKVLKIDEKNLTAIREDYFCIFNNSFVLQDSIGNFKVMELTSSGNFIVKGSLTALDTPYHVEKMKSEGVYTDFISYMDEKTAYDNQQREKEKAMQLAYEEALKENPNLTYEEFVATRPTTFIRRKRSLEIQEPVPSEALLKFKEKYLG